MAKYQDFTCVKVEIDEEGITWVTFNRPEKRNAMNPTLHFEMLEIMTALENDNDCKVIVLTGAGNSWSAGMDLKEYFRETENNPDLGFRATMAHRYWATYVTNWSKKPTIAMVNGYCFGGAFHSLAHCDIVVSADEATYGLSEVNWGIIPGGNVAKVFNNLVNHRDALVYAMTGRTFDGQKAVEMGVANISVPLAQLKEETIKICRELMEKSPMVLAYTKQCVRAVQGMDMTESFEYLGAKALALRTVDPRKTRATGMEEFLDKKTYRPGLQAVKKTS